MMNYIIENLHIYGATIGAIFGLIGTVIGVMFSWRCSNANEKKRIIVFLFSLALLMIGWFSIVFLAPKTWLVFAIPLYPILLLLLILSYIIKSAHDQMRK